MKVNPIFKREIMVSSRSRSLPALICVVNTLLFAVTLIGASGVAATMRMTAKSDYGAFLRIYGFVVLLEFMLLLFITPSLTSGAISSERERETLDLMFTTQMSPGEIVLGKLMSNMSFVIVLEITCIPAVLVALIYGGVTVREIGELTVIFTFEAFVFMSAGMFFSSFSKSTARATAYTYGFIVFLCFGTAVLSMLLSIISGGNNIMSLWILLINPLVNVANTVAGQMGETGLITEAALRLFSGGESLIIRGWSILGTALQLLMAAVMLLMAVSNISPRRKKKKELDFEL